MLNSAPIIPATDDAIQEAARALKRGELVAFPTETVYGLGADATQADAVRAIFAAKGRPTDHPLIVHFADAEAAAAWAADWPDSVRALADAFWPGPLTLIVRKAPHVRPVVTGGQDTVGLRVPAHPIAQALLRAVNVGIAAPSANRFGRISPTEAAHVAAEFSDGFGCELSAVGEAKSRPMILDGGPAQVGIESTIVDCTALPYCVLRPGAITPAALAPVLGYRPMIGRANAPRASGLLASHYAPRTPALLLERAALEARLALGKASHLLVFAPISAPNAVQIQVRYPHDPDAYAHELYATLRALDDQIAEEILIEKPPEADAWIAILDRLSRATFREFDV